MAKGICKVCGCTDDHACITVIGPCSWANPDEDLCSACVPEAEGNSEALMQMKQRILSMKPGREMDFDITMAMIEIAEEEFNLESFTTDQLAALRLWQFAVDSFGSVALVKYYGAPSIISEFCGIKAEDDDRQFVDVMTGDWMESLGKAFLLMSHGLYGSAANPEWDRKVEEAPKRNPH